MSSNDPESQLARGSTVSDSTSADSMLPVPSQDLARSSASGTGLSPSAAQSGSIQVPALATTELATKATTGSASCWSEGTFGSNPSDGANSGPSRIGSSVYGGNNGAVANAIEGQVTSAALVDTTKTETVVPGQMFDGVDESTMNLLTNSAESAKGNRAGTRKHD